jgi:heme o synthase
MLNPAWLLLVAVTLTTASAGANGLTNYLDRNLDVRMERTRNRSLPSKRIDPPEKVLPMTIGLVVIGLVFSWFITPGQIWHPAFIADLAGTLASIVWRKRATCVFPQGMIAGCAPVLIGWFAITPKFGWELALLCVMIGLWLPLHVWSVMISHRDEYIRAGIFYFPINIEAATTFKLLSGFVLALAIAAIAIYFVGNFSILYLAVAIVLNVIMIYSTLRLKGPHISRNAWRLYKLSSFPYLGIIFLVMSIDFWLK